MTVLHGAREFRSRERAVLQRDRRQWKIRDVVR